MNTDARHLMPLNPSPVQLPASPWLWRLGTAAVLAVLLMTMGCGTGLSAATASGDPMALRIENATASTVTVLVEVLDQFGNLQSGLGGQAVDIPVVTVGTDSVSFGVLTPIGASAAALTEGNSLLGGTQASVRVAGFRSSEGIVLCGELIRLTATLNSSGESAASVMLRGDGTGTPSFDDGSVGEAGVRFLVRGVDFRCGQSAVLRITDDGTGTGAGSSGNATGEIAVVNSGDASPFGPIDAPSGTGEDDPDTVEPTTIRVQIENLGDVISTTTLTVGTGDDEQTFTVTVPPLTTSAGEFVCGTQFTLLSRYPNPETPEDQTSEALVILTGDGTGSPGFDQNSVSREGERILILGTHVSCGDTIRVSLRDDVEPIGFQGIGVLGGVVEVVPGG